jgi:hypothetical protein
MNDLLIKTTAFFESFGSAPKKAFSRKNYIMREHIDYNDVLFCSSN